MKAREQFCLRADRFMSSAHRCAECNWPVEYNPRPVDGPVRLVCMECLLASGTNTGASIEDRLKPHPFVHGQHCAECATFAPFRAKYDARGWNGVL